MGEQNVSLIKEQAQMQKFVRFLLNDVRALEYMIENDMFENDITRIGAEQEMCLVNSKTYKPSNIAMEALDLLKEHPWVETELAQFNLETNLDPLELKGDCLSRLEKENSSKLNIIRDAIQSLDSDVILTGILPTLRQMHLAIENLTPKVRYKALMDAIDAQSVNNTYELRLLGIDELLVKHDSPLLEACNTSFQVHLQVAPKDFVKMYNIAQAIAGPVMAIASNSPIVFGRRLWHESRIALFQQALDTRTSHDHMRERSPRVIFGSNWIKNSILDIYREDITRFRVLLAGDVSEDSIQMLEKGKIPKLRALQIHNSTVYRWNRPCYGISPNGKPHLRIENRVFPAGPSSVDTVANAAFWLGLMIGMGKEHEDITKDMYFVDARDNFAKAAQYGIDSTFTWLNEKKISLKELFTDTLLPLAEAGLQEHKVDQKDINKYLDIIQQRVAKHTNGARWQLRSYTKLLEETTSRDEALSCLTASIIKNQRQNIPVHEWEIPKAADFIDYNPKHTKVEEFMVTDLYTVQPEDIIELVAELMDFKEIGFSPVEDKNGHLIGLITAKSVSHHYIKSKTLKSNKQFVKDIMIKNPPSIAPNATILEAMNEMEEKQIGCLPVTKGKELVGLVTREHILRAAGKLLKREQ